MAEAERRPGSRSYLTGNTKSAKKIQMYQNELFTIWKASDRNGDKATWQTDRLLYDPLETPVIQDGQNIFDHAPKRCYYSCRAVHGTLISGVGKREFKRFMSADFDANGHLLKSRRPRGFPGISSEGEIGRLDDRNMIGDRTLPAIDEETQYHATKVTEHPTRTPMSWRSPIG